MVVNIFDKMYDSYEEYFIYVCFWLCIKYVSGSF